MSECCNSPRGSRNVSLCSLAEGIVVVEQCEGRGSDRLEVEGLRVPGSKSRPKSRCERKNGPVRAQQQLRMPAIEVGIQMISFCAEHASGTKTKAQDRYHDAAVQRELNVCEQ